MTCTTRHQVSGWSAERGKPQILCRLQIDVRIEVHTHLWTELGLLQRRGEEYRGPVECYISSIECEVWHARNTADGRSITTTIQLYFADLETLRRYLDVLVNRIGYDINNL